MFNIGDNKKTVALVAAFLAVILAVVFFVVRPLLGQIAKSSSDLAQSRQVEESFFSNWREVKKAQQARDEIKSNLDKLQSILPSGDTIKFIEALENIASQSGNTQKISVVSQGAQVANPINFQIALSGSFPNLIKFLINVENLAYYSQVKSLNVNVLNAQSTAAAENGLAAGDVETAISLSVLTE